MPVQDNVGTRDKMHTAAGPSVLLAKCCAQRCLGWVRIWGGLVLSYPIKLRERVGFTEVKDRLSRILVLGKGRTSFQSTYRELSAFESSSGSAVVVSGNIVSFTTRTETDTSIIGPASINNIIETKPTIGLAFRVVVLPSVITWVSQAYSGGLRQIVSYPTIA